ncbi:MAG: cysteine desulfurase family protein [Elusimicrobiota bacterium]
MEVYLDNNATTPLSEEVLNEMAETMRVFGNASSLHSPGVKARKTIETARHRVATVLGSEEDEIIFTSGGTESDNLAIMGYLRTTDKKHIVTSCIEHPAVLNVFRYLGNTGYDIDLIGVDEKGRVDPEEFCSVLRDDTAMISIMMANNEVGAIQPVNEIVKGVKDYSEDIAVHTDAVQAFGKMRMNCRETGVDMLSVSAHKINGPKGVGALYVRRGFKIEPVYFGGHHERGLRPGTENVQGIAGFGKASEVAVGIMAENISRWDKLKKKLSDGISGSISDIRINSHQEYAISNTLNVSFRNVEGEAVLLMLDDAGINVSTGSACTSGTGEPSHVLKAMGLDELDAKGSIRFSLGRYNTEDEIDYVIEKLDKVISRLREVSPL